MKCGKASCISWCARRRTMKCGKASCPCQEDPKARHGPYYSLTRPMAGKTQSRYLSPEQAELARKQIEQGHKFREQVEQYREACERWADAQLERPQADRKSTRLNSSHGYISDAVFCLKNDLLEAQDRAAGRAEAALSAHVDERGDDVIAEGESVHALAHLDHFSGGLVAADQLRPHRDR